MLHAVKYYSTNRSGHPKPVVRAGRYVNRIPNAISYHANLHQAHQVSTLQFMYTGEKIEYVIRCNIDTRLYIGSTMNPDLRFSKHLITRTRSNRDLQQAISKFGLENFTAQVFKVVIMPVGATYKERKDILTQEEQLIMNRIPRKQLYNPINASSAFSNS